MGDTQYRPAIIIEGPDCAGKTTLANKLKEYYSEYNIPLDICHCTGHDPKDIQFYIQTMRKKNIIFDRHFIGEMIYPNVFNRIGELRLSGFKYLCNIATELKCPIIIVTPPNEVLLTRLKNERPNEEKEVKDKILLINNEFIKISKTLKENNLPVLIAEYTDNGEIDFDNIIHQIDNIWSN